MTPMEALLSGVGSVFTQATEWMEGILTTIVETPVLLVLIVAIPVISFSVGLAKRLISM